ncbi:DUF1566 domain-containing protein [Glaciecola sp. MH2013]|nr:DUF1566 domain-containing protein [Glaciecola sp. MH2013]
MGACLLLVQACGGGDADRPEPSMVLVNAGADFSVNEETTATLQGDARLSGSDNASLVYAWSSQPSLVITHDDTTTGIASFSAPTVTSSESFQLTLTVTYEDGTQGSDSLIVTVNPVNQPPIALISVEQDPNYDTDTFPILSTILLDGSGSSDADPQTSASAISAYSWQQTAGPNLLNGLNVNTASLQLSSPLVEQDTELTIVLEVTDQEGAVSQQSKTITLLAESKTIPELSVGNPQAVSPGEYFNLSASASSKARGAAPFSVRWSSNSPLAPIIDDFNSLKTFSIAPSVSETTAITYTVEIEDSYGNKRELSTEMTILAPVQTRINDTGVSINANNIALLETYQGEFAGQDAHFGNDTIAQSGLANKAGRGERGFDFTRLNQNGDEIDQDTSDWRCVRDNITGLIWENKTNDSNDIHFADNTFTWYQLADNGGFEGAVNSSSMTCNLSSQTCNTAAFVDEVNAQGLCGFFDWRLPTHTELMSLVHFGATNLPLVDSEYFPFMGQSSTDFLWYWTSQTNVDGVNELGSQSAWAIDYYSGVDNFIDKREGFRVKLVRAGR